MRIKYIALLLPIFTLAACSHVYVRNWGNGQVTTCCPSGKIVCTRSKMDDLASEQCGGEATPLSGGLVESGASGSAYQTLGGGTSVNVRVNSDSCVTYKCGTRHVTSATPSKPESCQDECFSKEEKHEFKDSESLESCLRDACK